MKKITFKECPRPQFVRDNYVLLDGKWDFYLDFENQGIEQHFENGFNKTHDIIVPFAYETPASGINIKKRCDEVWYQKQLELFKHPNKEWILHLEGSDYLTKVYVNGQFVGEDEGGYHRESFNLTPYLKDGNNLLVIHCHDDYDKEKPRGKQRWKDEVYGCFYIDTTGIWKSVWLEEVEAVRLNAVKMTPEAKEGKVHIIPSLCGTNGGLLDVEVSFEDKVLLHQQIEVENEKEFVIDIPAPLKMWDIDQGNLYDIKFKFLNDEVKSYFAFKDMVAKDGQFYLNGKLIKQQLVLDQGYYIPGHLTHEKLQDLYNDIVKMQAYGFNGCRKHQKVEDERFLYYADVLGYLVWAEMPSPEAFTPLMKERFFREWKKVVAQLYNFVCVTTWVPFNESWGIFDIKKDVCTQEFVNDIYHWTKSYDNHRFVMTNDGWHHTISDIITIHHYEQDGEKLHDYFADKELTLTQEVWTNHHCGAFADGYKYNGQPVMIDEFGGTAYKKDAVNGAWGYGDQVADDTQYIDRLSKMFSGLLDIDYLAGYCFTQVSDVQQEVNGLLFENRNDKVNPEFLRKIQKR